MLKSGFRRLDPRGGVARRRLTNFVRPVQEFVQTESASAVLLILAAGGALVWANSPWHASYEELLDTHLGVDLAFWAVEGTLHFWVNEVAMVLFFFVIGLEIKREITIGELSDPRVMAAPVAGAVGGMLLPLGLVGWQCGNPPGPVVGADNPSLCVSRRWPRRRERGQPPFGE